MILLTLQLPNNVSSDTANFIAKKLVGRVNWHYVKYALACCYLMSNRISLAAYLSFQVCSIFAAILKYAQIVREVFCCYAQSSL